MSLLHRIRCLRPTPFPLLCGICGACGLWLGIANPLMHIPLLALLYPASLALLGRIAPDYGSALRYGWLTGLVGSSAALSWIAVPVHEVGGLPWIAAAACATVIGAYIGLYAGVASMLAHAVRSLPLWRQAVAFGLGWWVLEGVRNWLFSGFPWLPLASAFVLWPSWIQGASLIGAYGLGGLLAGLACLLSLASLAAMPPVPRLPTLATLAPQTAAACPAKAHSTSHSTSHARKTALLACAIAILGYALLAAAGSWRLAMQGAQADTGPALSLTLVQGNINQNQKWDSKYQLSTIRRYMELSTPAEAKNLIIWPETSIPLAYGEHALSPTLRDWAAQQHTWLLFGSLGVRRTAKEYELFNRAYLISPQGQDQSMYEKEHLVPFGEYMPKWLKLPFLLPLLQGIGDFTSGSLHAPLWLEPTDEGTQGQGLTQGQAQGQAQRLALGVLICYETIFPELSQQRVADGAELLINISNDAWFGRSAAPEQHLQLSALRAVEQQRWLARGTNTGISALIDPFGRIRTRSSLFTAESLRGTVYARSEHTIFFYLFPYLLPAAAVLLALCLAMRPSCFRIKRKAART